MKTNFNEKVERRGTDSIKWNVNGMLGMAEYADEESIPMWVADMDFKVPNFLIEKMEERTKEGVYGYNIPSENYYKGILYWQKNRNNWDIKKDWIVTNTGVVSAICYSIKAFTEEGDGVVIQNPVYPPFKRAIEVNNRKIVNNKLKFDGKKYTIDFKDLEEKLKDPKNKMMILCNPHNPVGRVWKKEELEKIVELCLKYSITIISDEIHSDLALFNNAFTSLGTVNEKILDQLVVCTSISKTFNCAALKIANTIIPNNVMKIKFLNEMERNWDKPTANMYGAVAIESTYTKDGEIWLEELKKYLEKNYIYMKNFIEENFKNLKCIELEGTYLGWLDLREMNLEYKEIKRKIEREAKIVIDGGEIFGEEGEGFVRINFACHENVLKEALNRLKSTFPNE